jgi:toxin ParE1/3/4
LSAKYRIIISDVARDDLRQLRTYLIESADRGIAETIIDRLLSMIEGLDRFPERGPVPVELLPSGIRGCRQTSVPPYRIVYRLVPGEITVLIVADVAATSTNCFVSA